MTTLIIHKNPDGSITGRCDARCYNSMIANCTCICGGINHSVGLNKALYNTIEDRLSVIASLRSANLSFNLDQYEFFEGGKP